MQNTGITGEADIADMRGRHYELNVSINETSEITVGIALAMCLHK